MPRARKPARAYQRRDTGQWVIVDGRSKRRLALYGDGARAKAEQALADYIAQKALPTREKPGSRDEVKIGEILIRYLEDRGPHVTDPERLRFAVQALSPFWSDEPVSSIKGAMCRAYERTRGVGTGTVRRELGTLRAALMHAEREGYLESAPRVAMPSPPMPKDRWLTHEEYARLVEHAADHVKRFAWIAVATGTRAAAITKLRWVEGLDAGWIDTDSGTLYRAGAGETKTKKRRDSCRLPDDLAEACRAWRQDGSPYVIHIDGKPLAKIRKGFARAVERAGLEGVTPHILKHTAVTWAMQRGMPIERAAEYFSTSPEVLRRVYQAHHPEFTASAASMMRIEEN